MIGLEMRPQAMSVRLHLPWAGSSIMMRDRSSIRICFVRLAHAQGKGAPTVLGGSVEDLLLIKIACNCASWFES